MGWKHVDTIQIGLTSTKECVGIVVNIRSNKEIIKYSVETEGEETERIFLHVHSLGIRDGITQGQKDIISINKKMTTHV